MIPPLYEHQKKIIKENKLKCGLFLGTGASKTRTALEMAAGVRERLHTHVGISLTGIAGPSGATFGKPVGLVIFGYDDGKVRMTDHKTFTGEREEIKLAAAEHLITMTLELLHEE